MNVFLWILQGLLALLYVAGGAYKFAMPQDLAMQLPAVSEAAWRALGAIEIVGGIMLVLPGVMKWKPTVTALAAAALALETFGLAVLYARQSLEMTAANPLVWSVGMGLLVAVVAFGRYVSPRAQGA